MDKRIIFVYGTLKRGEFNDIERYAPKPSYLAEGWVAGQLYDLGHCPAMTLESSDAGPVWGEVFELDETLFAELDRYEDKCGDFPLQQVLVHLPDKVMSAWTYVGGPSTPKATRLPQGRWSAPRRARPSDMVALGGQALRVDFESYFSGLRPDLVRGFAHAVRQSGHPAVTEVVESGSSVTVHYRAVGLKPQAHPASMHAQMTAFLAALPVTLAGPGSPG